MAKFSFRLFIGSNSGGSVRARENLEKICQAIGEGSCEVEVIDVRQEPERAEAERIMALPTLIKNAPNPAVRIIGDLGDRERVLQLIGWQQSVQ